MNSNLSYSPETPNLGQIWQFLEPYDVEIWWMTLKNNRAPLLSNSSQDTGHPHTYRSAGSHWWIQTSITVRKRPIWVKFDDFYTPVWKTDVLCRGNVRPSVCPSVRPSVRPGFPDFSSTCFEISIWNLVYTFSRWHDMSILTCITIGSLWPSLQPKVGQTHFLQSWPHKSR